MTYQIPELGLHTTKSEIPSPLKSCQTPDVGTGLVGVAVAVGVGVPVAVRVGVAVAVRVGVLVAVRVGVTVGVLVGVGVKVLVGGKTGVGVLVAVGVGVRVAVGVGVRVAEGVGVPADGGGSFHPLFAQRGLVASYQLLKSGSSKYDPASKPLPCQSPMF